MKLPVNFLQPPGGDVRVNFRRADGRMPQQFLDYAQVRPVLEKMGRKTMPQHVRGDVA